MLRAVITALLALSAPPPDVPPEWREYIGEYGSEAKKVVVLEKDGTLFASEAINRYDPVGEGDFRRGADGKVNGLSRGSAVLPRLKLPEAGELSFRIQPQRPVAQLMKEAILATPPAPNGEFKASELVELAPLEPSLKFDIRYASRNNFLGEQVYAVPRALLQKPAAEAVVRVHRKLAAEGFGLLIHDAYRPWHVTKVFWEATPPAQRKFVADPAVGSRHNRGCAVDLTLFDVKTGKAVEMPGGYDEFSDRSYPDYAGGTSLQRWRRDRLRAAMEAEGFTVFEAEWWHFDYRDWKKYAVQNEPLAKAER
jgi:serine beta-lactamase-like protein LACTB